MNVIYEVASSTDTKLGARFRNALTPKQDKVVIKRPRFQIVPAGARRAHRGEGRSRPSPAPRVKVK